MIKVEDEIENQTLNCKISGDHQIQTLRSIGHLGPLRTSDTVVSYVKVWKW